MGTGSAAAIVGREARAFGRNLIGFLRFDPATCAAIQRDPRGAAHGLAAMLLASLAAAVGHVGLAGGERPLEVAFAGEIALWAVAAGLAWFLAITLFRPPRNPSAAEIVPLLGFAQVPQALGLLALAPVPALGMAGDAAGSVLFVVYVVAALRATVGFDLLRSAVNGVLGVTVAIVALVGVVVGNGLDAAALGAYRPIARQVSSLSAKVDQAVAPFVAVPAPVVPATVSGVVAAAPHPAVGKGKGKGTGKASPTAGPTATAADPAADLGPADAAKAAKRAKHHKPAKEVQPANDVEAVTVLEDLATPTADGKGGHHKGRAALEIGTPITAFP